MANVLYGRFHCGVGYVQVKNMFKCINCGRTFDEPDEYHTTYEAEYGVSDLFGNSHKVTILRCPYCHSEEIDEVMEYDDEE